MIQSNQKQSLLVPYELPKFVGENTADYANFTAFVKAYYEWMEQQNNVADYTKSLLQYMDVDTTTQEFLNYFINDFMSYFPQDILSDPTKVLKLAKQLYQNKGTPASYRLLFRILYNTDVDFFYTKDVVFKASSGNWYVPKSLKLATSDPNFLNINNLRVFGNISKSIATVETAIFDGLKTEVFISNIERLFQSGETVTVVDSHNQPIWFLNESQVPKGTVGAETLTAVIVGQISQVLINKDYRGLTYRLADPVVFYGGLNQSIANPLGATAEVNEVTSGSISSITVSAGGYGYALSPPNTQVGGVNTAVIFSNLVGDSPKTPLASVGGLDATHQANSNFIPVDSIQLKQNYHIGNIAGSSGANVNIGGFWTQAPYNFANNLTANANTTLANAFTFTSFSTYPISAIVVQDQGGGYTQVPTIGAETLYNTDATTQTNLANLGILAPIVIVSGGSGYANNDKISIIGGSGSGAYANVTSVDPSTGAITSVSYVNSPTIKSPLGGFAYNNGLPIVVAQHLASGNVTTSNTSNSVSGNGTSFLTQIANGAYLVSNTNVVLGVVNYVSNDSTLVLTSNASKTVAANSFYLGTSSLYVPGTLGTGAAFAATTNRIGAITSFKITENGSDYVSAPSVSLAVQDLIVTNVSPTSLVQAGDIIYQGANTNVATYIATVDSIIPLENFYTVTDSIYQLRVYNYTSKPVQKINGTIAPLIVDSIGASMNLVSGYTVIHNTTFDNSVTNSRFDSANGVIQYGDGYARATATFLNGLVVGNGQYIDITGQPSGFDVLQSTKFNNYTYEITLSKEIAKYRDVLLNLLHPTGTQVIGRIAMSSNNSFNYYTIDALQTGLPINYYADTGVITSIVNGTPNNPSNNIIKFDNLYNANLSNIFTPNTSIFTFTYGSGINDKVISMVTDVNNLANTITLQDNVWSYIANVAVGQAVNNGFNNVINITSVTNSYNIINNGYYSNTQYPLIDIIRTGDKIYVNGVSQTVTSIAYTTNIIKLSGSLTSGANGFISVSRTLTSLLNNIQIYGSVGPQYFVELITQDGKILTDQQGNALLIG